MKTNRVLIAVVAGLLWVSAPVLADWNEGDPCKMHFPQLPDPNGWDVCLVHSTLADDFKCTETGPITDIHFWYSFQQDLPSQVIRYDVSVYSDVPPGPGMPYSHPGQMLWGRSFEVGDVQQRLYGAGSQGWYCPENNYWQRPDHFNFYQANITNIQDPFIQTMNSVYWLSIRIEVQDENFPVGWKTSQNHWQDAAVWYNPTHGWEPLYDPILGGQLDMAFVITPEPSSFLLLGLATLALRRR
jgi:hypothetical protein